MAEEILQDKEQLYGALESHFKQKDFEGARQALVGSFFDEGVREKIAAGQAPGPDQIIESAPPEFQEQLQQDAAILRVKRRVYDVGAGGYRQNWSKFNPWRIEEQKLEKVQPPYAVPTTEGGAEVSAAESFLDAFTFGATGIGTKSNWTDDELDRYYQAVMSSNGNLSSLIPGKGISISKVVGRPGRLNDSEKFRLFSRLLEKEVEDDPEMSALPRSDRLNLLAVGAMDAYQKIASPKGAAQEALQAFAQGTGGFAGFLLGPGKLIKGGGNLARGIAGKLAPQLTQIAGESLTAGALAAGSELTPEELLAVKEGSSEELIRLAKMAGGTINWAVFSAIAHLGGEKGLKPLLAGGGGMLLGGEAERFIHDLVNPAAAKQSVSIIKKIADGEITSDDLVEQGKHFLFGELAPFAAIYAFGPMRSLLPGQRSTIDSALEKAANESMRTMGPGGHPTIQSMLDSVGGSLSRGVGEAISKVYGREALEGKSRVQERLETPQEVELPTKPQRGIMGLEAADPGRVDARARAEGILDMAARALDYDTVLRFAEATGNPRLIERIRILKDRVESVSKERFNEIKRQAQESQYDNASNYSVQRGLQYEHKTGKKATNEQLDNWFYEFVGKAPIPSDGEIVRQVRKEMAAEEAEASKAEAGKRVKEVEKFPGIRQKVREIAEAGEGKPAEQPAPAMVEAQKPPAPEPVKVEAKAPAPKPVEAVKIEPKKTGISVEEAVQIPPDERSSTKAVAKQEARLMEIEDKDLPAARAANDDKGISRLMSERQDLVNKRDDILIKKFGAPGTRFLDAANRPMVVEGRHGGVMKAYNEKSGEIEQVIPSMLRGAEILGKGEIPKTAKRPESAIERAIKDRTKKIEEPAESPAIDAPAKVAVEPEPTKPSVAERKQAKLKQVDVGDLKLRIPEKHAKELDESDYAPAIERARELEEAQMLSEDPVVEWLRRKKLSWESKENLAVLKELDLKMTDVSALFDKGQGKLGNSIDELASRAAKPEAEGGLGFSDDIAARIELEDAIRKVAAGYKPGLEFKELLRQSLVDRAEIKRVLREEKETISQLPPERQKEAAYYAERGDGDAFRDFIAWGKGNLELQKEIEAREDLSAQQKKEQVDYLWRGAKIEAPESVPGDIRQEDVTGAIKEFRDAYSEVMNNVEEFNLASIERFEQASSRLNQVHQKIDKSMLPEALAQELEMEAARLDKNVTNERGALLNPLEMVISSARLAKDGIRGMLTGKHDLSLEGTSYLDRARTEEAKFLIVNRKLVETYRELKEGGLSKEEIAKDKEIVRLLGEKKKVEKSLKSFSNPKKWKLALAEPQKIFGDQLVSRMIDPLLQHGRRVKSDQERLVDRAIKMAGEAEGDILSGLLGSVYGKKGGALLDQLGRALDGRVNPAANTGKNLDYNALPPEWKQLYHDARRFLRSIKVELVENSEGYKNLQRLYERAVRLEKPEDAKKILRQMRESISSYGVDEYLTSVYRDDAHILSAIRFLPHEPVAPMRRKGFSPYLISRIHKERQEGEVDNYAVRMNQYLGSIHRYLGVTKALQVLEPVVNGKFRWVDPRRAAKGSEVYYKGQKHYVREPWKEGDQELKMSVGGHDIDIPTSEVWKFQRREGGLMQMPKSGGETSRLFQYAKEMIDYLKRGAGEAPTNLDKAINVVQKGIYHNLIGVLNVPSAATNYVGGQHAAIAELGPDYWARANKMYATKEGQQLIRNAGILMEPFDLFFPGGPSTKTASTEARRKVKAALSKAGGVADDVSFAAFMLAEKMNRGVSYLGGYIRAKDASMGEKAAHLKGLESVGITQHWYIRGFEPKLLQNRWVKAAATLNTYGLRHATTALRWAQNIPKDPAKAARALAYAGLATWAYQALTGRDLFYVFGTRMRDLPGALGSFGTQLEMAAEEKGWPSWMLVLPGLLAPFDWSPTIKLPLEAVDAAIQQSRGRDDAWEKFYRSTKRILIGTQVDRFRRINGWDDTVDKATERIAGPKWEDMLIPGQRKEVENYWQALERADLTSQMRTNKRASLKEAYRKALEEHDKGNKDSAQLLMREIQREAHAEGFSIDPREVRRAATREKEFPGYIRKAIKLPKIQRVEELTKGMEQGYITKDQIGLMLREMGADPDQRLEGVPVEQRKKFFSALKKLKSGSEQ